MSILPPYFFRRILLAVLLLLAAGHSYSGEARTVSLIEYIDLANRSGMNVIYSSDLLRKRYRVTFDTDNSPSLASLTKALAAYSLSLKEIAPNTYTVVIADAVPSTTQPTDAQLTEVSLPLEEVVVSSSRYRLYSGRAFTAQALDAQTLAARPVTANDATRVVNQLPGSASVGVSARPRVRGGNEDETLILFDGVRLYSPFHFNRFNSLFSSFDSRLLANIDFYSGGFPTSLGDRLSAAMLMTTKDNSELIGHREVGVGLFNLSYLQGVDLGEDSLAVSLRRSNFELVDQFAKNDLGNPSFGDLFARYSRELSNEALLDVNVLWFGDDIEINNSSETEEAESHYANTYIWAKVTEELSEQLSRTTVLGAAQSLNDREGRLNQSNQVTGTIKDDQTFRFYFANQGFEYLGQLGLIAFGWDYRYLTAEYEFLSEKVTAPEFARLSNISRGSVEAANVEESGHQAAVYVSWKQRVLENLSLEAGLRLDIQRYESTIQDESLDYRLGLLYEPYRSVKLRIGWGKYSQAQGIHELNVSDLERGFQPTQSARHLVAGIDYEMNRFTARIEAYRKTATDTRPYYQNLANPYTLIPELQADRFLIEPSGYQARGVEFSLEGLALGGEWWINFSQSAVKDDLPGKNIRRSWDQARSFNLGYHRNIGEWQFGMSTAFHEGWLTTPLRFDGVEVVAGERNSQRFDHFVSVDLKVLRSWQLSRGGLRLEMGLTNVFDRENQIGVNYELVGNQLTATPEMGLPVAPFLDVYWSF